MAIGAVLVDLTTVAGEVPALASNGVALAVLSSRPVVSADVVLWPASVGLEPGDPRLVAMAAAGVNCHLRDLLVVAGPGAAVLDAAATVGARTWELTDVADLAAAIDQLAAADQQALGLVGVGPHPEPWPHGEQFDPALLGEGDRRNVEDRYRYWREDAIVADLDAARHPVHVAVENWQHDLNIGTVVRNANAFNVAGVHIVGKRRWNRRGAMATDRYLHVTHHASVEDLVGWAAVAGLTLVGFDNVAGALPLESSVLPERSVLVFGQEGPGLSDAMVAACSEVYAITQHGSTRSINAGVASGIALYAWACAHGRPHSAS